MQLWTGGLLFRVYTALPHSIENGVVVIMSYEALRLEVKMFKQIQWYYIILDEG